MVEVIAEYRNGYNEALEIEIAKVAGPAHSSGMAMIGPAIRDMHWTFENELAQKVVTELNQIPKVKAWIS